MTTSTLISNPPTPHQVRSLIKSGCSYVGLLAELSHDDFVAMLEDHGGQYISYTHGARIPLLVIGDAGLPITPAGDPIDLAGRVAISEAEFIAAMGESVTPTMYSLTSLADLLKVPAARIKAWVRAGLIKPAVVQAGVMHFDFRQVSLARTLSDLMHAGVGLGKVRRSLEQLRSRLPHLDEPLHQLSMLEVNGPLLVRLEAGDVVDVEGQFQLDFEQRYEDPIQLHGLPQPKTAKAWHEQGIEQEQAGLLEDAEDSYRQALHAGGPDPQICFDLAAVLVRLRKLEQAAERYCQVVEMDPSRADGWNNLGLVLEELQWPEQALAAYRRAVKQCPDDATAHYNLADSADRLGDSELANEHFREYLRLAPAAGPHSDYARQRLERA